MSEQGPKPATDWRRIGLIAAVTLVPGGFLLGAALAMRRMQARAEAEVPAGEAAPNDKV
ncbi:hypothetical protein [Sphingomonas sp.]|uniref:hypothetical protein n=1 Tax=Sphingomonas sp. TaxID=28214 RepID=UPI00333EE55F